TCSVEFVPHNEGDRYCLTLPHEPLCFLGIVLTDPTTDTVKVGEYLCCVETHTEGGKTYNKGDVVRVDEVVENASDATKDYGSFGPVLMDGIWRKAKPWEIEMHFTKIKEDTKSADVSKEDVGYKEEEGKLTYELDWDFIKAMAQRMQKGKVKYGPYNWKKPIDTQSLLQALFRHTIEVMDGNYEDDGSIFGHLEAIACDVMMIRYQLKHYEQKS